MSPACEVSYRNMVPSEAINHCVAEAPAEGCHAHIERARGAVVVLLGPSMLGRPLTLRRRLPGSAREADVCAALRSAFRTLAVLAPAPH